ncbi:M23 family metallopeptidase [Fulvivirga maritima]|uniref:M23 family metallopeptidase n=1 Tax=Fulvivirga maritima TaxID=2904247 RepID=UPI001F3662EE|nr:M23 family metallopeptidase [Fulvivirga maritima]UII26526.1 M23 family metallopeptidase [Fulvivirga maritima]
MKKRKIIALLIFLILIIGFIIPQDLSMPVRGASKSDYNSESFWYYPWGKSVAHKGVDIFAEEGTVINPSTKGLVLYAGEINIGGKVVLVLGPKWRFHYYAHLRDISTATFTLVNKTDTLGTVGASGNVAGKAPHLHYSIMTLLPYVWKIDDDRQGWKKMFYLNPIEFIEED